MDATVNLKGKRDRGFEETSACKMKTLARRKRNIAKLMDAEETKEERKDIVILTA